VGADWLADVGRLARAIRVRVLDATIANNGAYLCQACCSAEILATLHVRVMNRTRGDLFVLSPAHYCLALWALLAEIGELSDEEFDTYNRDGSALEMIGSEHAPGLLFTTGSLSQGLSQAIGLQLARRAHQRPGRVFVYLSDGELQEGQTWEAVMSAAHFGLGELNVVIDMNGSQVDGDPAEIMAIEPVMAKLCAFGLEAVEIDGHDPRAIAAALAAAGGERPRAVACRTRMWEGIPSLEARANHHFVRFRAGEAEAALADLGLSGEAVGRS
jgi:transketolase